MLTRFTRIIGVRHFLRAICLLGMLLLTGCAHAPFIVVDPDALASKGTAFMGQSTFYLIYEDTGRFSLWSAHVSIDDLQVATFQHGTYTCFPVTPGLHVVRVAYAGIAGIPSVAIKIDIHAANTYYFLYSTDLAVPGTSESGYGFRELSLPQAQQFVAVYSERQANHLEGTGIQAQKDNSCSAAIM